MPAITITAREFRQLPDEFQRRLLSHFTSDGQSVESAGSPEDAMPDDIQSSPIVSNAIALQMLDSFSLRTQQVLRAIVTAPEEGFLLDDLARQFDVTPGKLGAIWTAITKVSTRISQNPAARLIIWKRDDDGAWTGRLLRSNRRSFRKALGIG